MITREKFRSLMDYITTMHEREDEFFEKYGDIFQIDWLCQDNGLINTTKQLKMFSQLIDDPDDWLEYFYYECECDWERLGYYDLEDNYHEMDTPDKFYDMIYEKELEELKNDMLHC